MNIAPDIAIETRGISRGFWKRIIIYTRGYESYFLQPFRTDQQSRFTTLYNKYSWENVTRVCNSVKRYFNYFFKPDAYYVEREITSRRTYRSSWSSFNIFLENWEILRDIYDFISYSENVFVEKKKNVKMYISK